MVRRLFRDRNLSVTMNSNQAITATFNPVLTSGSLTGTWTGNVTENSGGCVFTGTMSWILTETGSTLTGTLPFSGTLTSGPVDPCGATVSATDTIKQGSVTGNNITLTGSQGEVFTATVSGGVITGNGIFVGPYYNTRRGLTP